MQKSKSKATGTKTDRKNKSSDGYSTGGSESGTKAAVSSAGTNQLGSKKKEHSSRVHGKQGGHMRLPGKADDKMGRRDNHSKHESTGRQHTEVPSWRKPAGSFSAKAKKEYLQWKRAQKRSEGVDEDSDGSQGKDRAIGSTRAHADSGAPGFSGRGSGEAKEQKKKANKRERGLGTQGDDGHAPFQYVPLVQVPNGEGGIVHMPIANELEMGVQQTTDARCLMPMRPDWRGRASNAEQLERLEEAAFASWRDKLVDKWGRDCLGFFEERLEFWRQLWRVLERSDVILVLLDARCPLLHFPESLVRHVMEDRGLSIVLVLNKADLVPPAAADSWIHYFKNRYPGVSVVISSASRDEATSSAEAILNSIFDCQVASSSQSGTARSSAARTERKGRSCDVADEGGEVRVRDVVGCSVQQAMEMSRLRNTHSKRGIVLSTTAGQGGTGGTESTDVQEHANANQGQKLWRNGSETGRSLTLEGNERKERTGHDGEKTVGHLKPETVHYLEREEAEEDEGGTIVEASGELASEAEEDRRKGRTDHDCRKTVGHLKDGTVHHLEMEETEEEEGEPSIEDSGKLATKEDEEQRKEKTHHGCQKRISRLEERTLHHLEAKEEETDQDKFSAKVSGGSASETDEDACLSHDGESSDQDLLSMENSYDEYEGESEDEQKEKEVHLHRKVRHLKATKDKGGNVDHGEPKHMPENLQASGDLGGSCRSLKGNTRQGKQAARRVVVGVTGEPNVGKSSTLNALLGAHRVAVSSHPGRTKHYQTHLMTPQLMLVDCPGIVFPRPGVPHALQVVFGSFPIAACRQPMEVIRYLGERLHPRLEEIFGLHFPPKELGEEQHWSPEFLCEALALKRGWTSKHGGRPDVHRAANYILRAALAGRDGVCLAYLAPDYKAC